MGVNLYTESGSNADRDAILVCGNTRAFLSAVQIGQVSQLCEEYHALSCALCAATYASPKERVGRSSDLLR